MLEKRQTPFQLPSSEVLTQKPILEMSVTVWETAGKWRFMLAAWILPACNSVFLSFSSFPANSVLWEMSP